MNKTGLDDYLQKHSAKEFVDLPTSDANGPKEQIRLAANDGEKVFDKRRNIAGIAQAAFESRGTFYRTIEGRGFFFDDHEKKLHDLEQKEFGRLLTYLTGLSSTEDYFRFVIDILQSHVTRNGKMVNVYTFASYNQASGELAVSDGGSHVWFYKNGHWRRGSNGDNGAIFLTDPNSDPWAPEFSNEDDGENLSWFLEQINFEGDDRHVLDQKALLRIWLVFLYFRSYFSIRPIPAFFGPKGSGKSTITRMIGRLHLGGEFNVTGLRADKEDAFVAGLTNSVFYVADNADSRIKWLEDGLARYATGETYRLRSLYSTNTLSSYKATAILMLTSRDPKFRRADVAERLLPFELKRFSSFREEPALFGELKKRRGRIIGDLMSLAAKAAEAIRTIPPPELSYRMADFAGFGWRIYKKRKTPRAWLGILERLEKAQTTFASEEDTVISIMRELLESGQLKSPLTTGAIFALARGIALRERIPFSNTAQGFGRKLRESERTIELELGYKIVQTSIHAGKVSIAFQKVRPISSTSVTKATRPGDTGYNG